MKSKGNNLNKKNIIIFIALILFVMYILFKVITLIKNPTKTFMVEKGKVYKQENAIGYIIREETVIKGQNYKNGMYQIKAEGDKIAKGEAIFRYYYNKEDNLNQKIEDLDKKIDEAMMSDNTVFNGDIKVLEDQIEEKLHKIYYTNDLIKIREYKKDIGTYIVKKARIAGELSPAGSYLKKLIDERSKYENELNSGTEYVQAPQSGILSYKVDGYEDILKTNDMSYLNTKFLEDLDLKVGQTVATSQESGKIINNFQFYIACSLKSPEARNTEVGDVVDISIPSGKQIEAEIYQIIDEDERKIIIFKISEGIQELVSCRKISFDIIWWSKTGKKVPNIAIGYENVNGQQVPYVIRTRAGYEDKIIIKILKQNDSYSIVDNMEYEELVKLGYTEKEIRSRSLLTLYDEILNKPTL